MTDLAAVKFFITPLHKCSYLPRQDAITLFADPKAEVNQNLYSDLSEMGFRRSGNYLYRPHCRQCAACIPVRIPSETFTLSRKQKRVIKRNSDLKVTAVDPIYSEEHYQLYQNYIEQKHSDGDMYPPSPEQYASFLLSDWGNTVFFEFRDANKQLLAVSVCDILENGISAVYTFYDINQPKRSLGVMAVLWQIEEAKNKGLPSVYLGYWIKECQKMSYKTDYRPLEMLIDDQWVQTNTHTP
ncbi:MAG: arginyltransferase [Pseudomonadales bacterium]|nr:arginyltransferase [Pseudomonadales bacterium]